MKTNQIKFSSPTLVGTATAVVSGVSSHGPEAAKPGLYGAPKLHYPLLNRILNQLVLKSELLRTPVMLLVILFFLSSGYAETPRDLKIQVSDGPNPWTHLDLANDPDSFRFAIIADLTAGLRPGVFENAVEKLNLMQPEFVMCVGDMIQGGITDVAELERQWDEFDGWIKHLQAPFFYLPGNHDVGNKAMTEEWEKRLGPSYYHFLYSDVLFLVGNTDDPPERSISLKQISYFKDVLDSNRDVRWTVVFLHRPTWLPDYSGKTPANSEKFEALLKDRPHTVFAGHDHKYSKATRNGFNYYVLSTTGAQGRGEKYVTSRGNNSMKLLGREKGEFDHFMWVTMTEDGPVVANLLLDGVLDDDPVPE